MKLKVMKALTGKLGRRAMPAQAMSRRTTWGIGGPAWCVCRVHTAGELAFVLTSCKKAEVACMPLGRGSNLLVSDDGYTGVMIILAGELARVEVSPPFMEAGGGAHLPLLVKQAAINGLSGLEWAVGIPASFGGAVAGNAGAHGADMAGLYTSLTLMAQDGEIFEMKPGEIKSGYRRGALPKGSVLINGRLELTPDKPERVAARTKELLALRKRCQPLSARTAGSVFKNPPGNYAARLIDQAGLKGLRLGDAMVSTWHANFIENRGHARAGEVLGLIDKVKRRVRERFGVDLETEIEVVGRV